MIDFRLVSEQIEYQGCDTLMFTSKQAVVSAEAIDPMWKERPTIAIGGATAGQIERLGGRVLYHPKHFYGQTLAEDILKHFQARRVLYLRPRTVSFDSRTFLAQAGYDLREQIIYETFCRPYTPQDAPPHGSIIIFTSPSTIECFLGNFEWLSSYTAVVIGESTKVHLPKGCDFAVSDVPLIDSCIKRAMEIT